ncbi:hypothetical protein [Bradyrhizobium sp.]|uniref:hypothetical protein n=1 Tax=Bradyrhizobium sp. TaxID=376 RepID=UPI003C65AADE
MQRIVIIAASLLLSSPVLAQGTSNPQTPAAANPQQSSSTPSPETTAKIAQQIKTNLEHAGFKNIKLMPSSFLVRAEDQNNNPVMMVINPDSITEVSENEIKNTNQGTNGPNTVGQGSNSTSNSSNSNNTSNPSQGSH